MSSDDARLVEGLLCGEPGAWDLFVERYSGLVAGTARRILAGRGRVPAASDVDDVTENVFVMLLERDGRLLRKYDPAHSLAAYVAVLTRTAVHRWLRRQKAKVDLPSSMWEGGIPEEALTASDQTAQTELREVVQTELNSLSSKEQRILRMFYYEERDYQEIAGALGVSINSVGAALSRARTKLGKALRGRDDLTESDYRSL